MCALISKATAQSKIVEELKMSRRIFGKKERNNHRYSPRSLCVRLNARW